MPADDFDTEHWPTEIRLRKQEKILEILRKAAAVHNK